MYTESAEREGDDGLEGSLLTVVGQLPECLWHLLCVYTLFVDIASY